MPPPRAPTIPQFARRLAIETPEHLVLELELAGVGSRIAAAACDAVLLSVVYMALGIGVATLQTRTGPPGPWSTLAAVLVVLAAFLVFWCYFLLFEALNHGRTPGKQLMGIRVVMDTGHPITDPAARFAPRFPRRDADPEAFLVRLHTAEFEKRSGRLAARPTEGVGRTTVVAERFVTRKRDSWEAFRTLAARAERIGLKQLGAAEIPGFAARYREVAADLARARTYGVDPRVLEYLERVVSAGHNAVYGRHIGHRVHMDRLVLRELPAAVVAARAYVVTALLMFAVPAMTGYVLIRERPAIAEQVLTDEMLARARAGAEHRAQGVGYAQQPSMYLPVVATGIITNNVQVAFLGFAFGITAGIGTVLLLVFNGLYFGAVLGLFANYGLAGWLLTFVAGHGVLELSAIFIAGGAGLLVARALLAPGDLTRRDALVLAGRQAVRLVGASVLLLGLAGTIEGLLSASDAPAPFKFATSGATVVLLILYLASGRHYLNSQATGQPGEQAASAASGSDRR